MTLKLTSSRADEPIPRDPLTSAIRIIVSEAVHEALAELLAELREPVTEYRDRQQEAQRLQISVTTLDRLCRDGLPFVRVGDSRRFLAVDVDSWLRARTREET